MKEQTKTTQQSFLHPVDYALATISQDVPWWHIARRLLTLAGLQVAWCLRSIVMPVLAGMGTAASFTAVDNAADIALNAVAILFVFEFDNLFVRWFVNERETVAVG